MNRSTPIKILSVLLVSSWSTSLVIADPPKPRPTHEDLLRKRQSIVKKREVSEVPAKPLVKPKKRSLIASSTLLSDGVNWTLIPKGSVIVVPEQLKNKLVSKPVGKLVEWKRFLARNGSWLHTHPIQMRQAQGKETLDPDRFKKLRTLNKIVVATCAKGPISVSPDSFPEEDEE